MITALGLLTRWALFAGLLTMVGSCVGRWVASGLGSANPDQAPAGQTPADHAREDSTAPGHTARMVETPGLARLAPRLGQAASGLTLAAFAALFALQLADFRDPFAPLRDDAAFLLGSSWGRAWSLGVAGATLGLIGFTVAGRQLWTWSTKLGWALAVAASVGLTLQPAFTGHAQTGPQPWAWMADGLHVLGAGLWIGTLPIVLFGALRASLASGSSSAPALELLHRFTPWALSGAALLAISGTFAAWLHLTTPLDLITTRYGQLLLTKLLIVGGVIGLGALNWRRNVPRLDQGDPQPLRRTALIEWALAQTALAVTAALVHTTPPTP